MEQRNRKKAPGSNTGRRNFVPYLRPKLGTETTYSLWKRVPIRMEFHLKLGRVEPDPPVQVRTSSKHGNIFVNPSPPYAKPTMGSKVMLSWGQCGIASG